MNQKHKVLIVKCDQDDADKISGIIKEGMQELGAKPAGNILMKPNVVLAHPQVFPHAFTRKEFLEGTIMATKSLAPMPRKSPWGSARQSPFPPGLTSKWPVTQPY